MKSNPSEAPTRQNSLRLWPGILVAVAMLALRGLLPWIDPENGALGIFGGIAGAVLILLWWLFLSRANWKRRIGAILLMGSLLAATSRFVHPSISNGMMGMLLPIYAMPVLCWTLAGWAATTQRLSNSARWASLAAAFMVVCSGFLILRTDGISGDAVSYFRLRWTPSAEEQLLSNPHIVAGTIGPDAPPSGARSEKDPSRPPLEWAGYRGAERNGVVRGVRLSTNWTASPPVMVWRRAVGPGWSSFAVRGNSLYTQEQRGTNEVVACYRVDTGEPVWQHLDETRFWESNAGAGPRGTPTLAEGKIYTFGATGILNALDAITGSLIWSCRPPADTEAKIPEWGFASSPLLISNSVVVATGGRLAAYEFATGRRRWLGPTGGGGGYGSPHRLVIEGSEQIAFQSGTGVIGVSPSDGSVLWRYPWRNDGILQPFVLAGGDILIGSGSGIGGSGVGVRRLHISKDAQTGSWNVQETWTTTGLKPYFSDVVADRESAYGLDGGFLACIGLKDGKRQWKDGRYGSGQLILIEESQLLLVVSERGDLVLADASGRQFTELGQFHAIRGKTWNHPALVGDLVLIRNSEEMAAVRLPIIPR